MGAPALAAAAQVVSAQAASNQKSYLSFITQAEKLDQFMREQEMTEKVFGGAASVAKGERKKERDDAASQAMYKMKSLGAKDFHRK